MPLNCEKSENDLIRADSIDKVSLQVSGQVNHFLIGATLNGPEYIQAFF